MREKVDYIFVNDGTALIKQWFLNSKLGSSEISFHDISANPVRPFFLNKKDIPNVIEFLEQFLPQKLPPVTGLIIAVSMNNVVTEYNHKTNPERLRGHRFKFVAISGRISKELVDTLRGCCAPDGTLIIDKDTVIY